MNILGVSAHFHDAAAALICEGRVVAVAAEERFSRQKHDSGFPRHAIRYCLEEAGITESQLDSVVFYEQPHIKFTRVLASTLRGFPFSLGPFVDGMSAWLGGKLFMRNAISSELGIHPKSIHFVPHHTSHAAHAFLTSSFEEAAVLTVDAVGEWSCTSLVHGRRGKETPIQLLENYEYPHSLGLLYAAFTGFLGFRPNSEECSTMALAAFGRPNYVDAVRKVVIAQPDGSYRLDASYFDFLATNRLPFTRRFIGLFGEAAPRGFKYELDALSGVPNEMPEAVQRYADIAASLQVVLEEILLGLAHRVHELTGSKNLCLAGGVALNCVANSRLLKDGPFDSLYIPPDPGDGGGALGAALMRATQQGMTDVGLDAGTPYLGNTINAALAAEMVEYVDHDNWTDLGPGTTATRGPSRVVVERCDSEEVLIDRTISMLRDGAVIGWVQGRFENGPRALGNRSLLADPSSVETARRIGTTIKRRAPFRPYAFAVTAEDASRVLQLDGQPLTAYRWMQLVGRVRQEMLPRVRGATHADGTTRPQVCHASDNPRFHRLLTAYGKATGLAALLNTSLNERGIPMVASAVEALAMLARTDMDAVVLEDVIIRKEW